jgi:hypothetical protein
LTSYPCPVDGCDRPRRGDEQICGAWLLEPLSVLDLRARGLTPIVPKHVERALRRRGWW